MSSKPRIVIQGIPYDANSSFLRGAALGPQAIEKAFFSPSTNSFSQNGTDLNSFHDQWTFETIKGLEDLSPADAFISIYEATCQQLKDHQSIISIGGDHSITFPIIKGYVEKYPSLHILQIDAHGDLYDNFDNNPFSHASPFARIMENGLVDSLTQIGNRTLTSHQRQQAQRFGVQIIEMKDFNLTSLPKLNGPLYVTLDLDALDPAFAPGVAHHEPGGLSTREILQIIEHIQAPIVGADIVELNPQRDWQNMTAMVAAKFLKELLAKMLYKDK